MYHSTLKYFYDNGNFFSVHPLNPFLPPKTHSLWLLVFGFGSFLLGSLAGNLIRSRLTGAQVQFAGRKEREKPEKEEKQLVPSH